MLFFNDDSNNSDDSFLSSKGNNLFFESEEYDLNNRNLQQLVFTKNEMKIDFKTLDKYHNNNVSIDITKTKENTNANNKDNIGENEIKNKIENVKEFNEIKNGKDTFEDEEKIIHFNSKKKGRPKKSQQNNEKKNNCIDRKDNIRKKIFNSCKRSIYKFINILVLKYGQRLHVPTIEKQLGYSVENNRKFCEKKIYDIFCDSTPKRLKDEIKYNRENYNHNKKIIDRLLNKEKNVELLNRIFNLNFGDFLKAYLNDENEIITNDNYHIHLEGFEFFSECYNEYANKEKNKLKSQIIDIIEGTQNKIKPRAKKRY